MYPWTFMWSQPSFRSSLCTFDICQWYYHTLPTFSSRRNYKISYWNFKQYHNVILIQPCPLIQPCHFMLNGFHVADSELSIQQPIPWVTQPQRSERACECNLGRRLLPHKCLVFPACPQGTLGYDNKQLLMVQGLRCWQLMERQGDFSAEGNKKNKRNSQFHLCLNGITCINKDQIKWLWRRQLWDYLNIEIGSTESHRRDWWKETKCELITW